jgi:hypothetical protein
MGINVGFFFGEIIFDLELVQYIEKIDHDSSLQKNTYKLDFACFFQCYTIAMIQFLSFDTQLLC